MVRLVRVITFKLDEETILKLNRVANELGISRSEVIRAAILSYISKKTDEKARTRRVLLK
ncbi:MAG: ribbon-helix-helix protein, CopG family [Sulfolobales archaeon]